MRECHVVNRHDTNKAVLNSVIKLGGLFCFSSFCVLCSISRLFCLSSFCVLCSIGMLHKMTLLYEIYELRKRITNIHIQKIKVKVSICFSNLKCSTF